MAILETIFEYLKHTLASSWYYLLPAFAFYWIISFLNSFGAKFKECPGCKQVVLKQNPICQFCGHEFPQDPSSELPSTELPSTDKAEAKKEKRQKTGQLRK